MFSTGLSKTRMKISILAGVIITIVFSATVVQSSSLIIDDGEICWILDRIDIRGAWEITTGSEDIIVAVLDSGIDFDHPDLAHAQWINKDEKPDNGKDDDENGYIDDRVGWDFYYNDSIPGPDDITLHHAHATFVAGIIAAKMDGYGLVGVAPNIKLMNLRVLNTHLYLRGPESLAEAIIYAVDNGADVINMNIDGADNVTELYNAIRYAYYHNVIMISSVGGFGWTNRRILPRECIEFPGAYDEVICVSSTDYTDGYASYSNWGYGIDVATPSGDLEDDEIYYANSTWSPLGYTQLYGISHVPQASGVVALMKSLNRSITLEQAREFLTTTARDIGTPGYDIYFGYGMINATAAIIETNKIAEPRDTTISYGVITLALIIAVISRNLIIKRKEYHL